MAERVSRRLVLLSSAAIGAVYLAGYLGTEGADASLAAGASTTTTTASSQSAAPGAALATARTTTVTVTTTITAGAGATSQAPAPAKPVAPTPPRPTATPPPTVAPQPTATATVAASGLRDGTYAGSGSSRRGDISVALTVKSGRIANVAITDATTQYPVSWISALPSEVVANQSDQVDLVSGATFSSIAFQGAVQQALAQAQA